jgi:protein-L-isoaspartate O-methyltransferase
VVPIGAEGEQELMRITREDNRLKRDRLGAVAFVPLVQGPV